MLEVRPCIILSFNQFCIVGLALTSRNWHNSDFENQAPGGVLEDICDRPDPFNFEKHSVECDIACETLQYRFVKPILKPILFVKQPFVKLTQDTNFVKNSVYFGKFVDFPWQADFQNKSSS